MRSCLHSSAPTDWMSAHLFWLNIVRLTNPSLWFDYYRLEFLKSYKALHSLHPTTDYVNEFAPGSATDFRWGLPTLTSFRIKAADLKVVLLDPRVPWVFPSSTPSVSSSSSCSPSFRLFLSPWCWMTKSKRQRTEPAKKTRATAAGWKAQESSGSGDGHNPLLVAQERVAAQAELDSWLRCSLRSRLRQSLTWLLSTGLHLNLARAPTHWGGAR